MAHLISDEASEYVESIMRVTATEVKDFTPVKASSGTRKRNHSSPGFSSIKKAKSTDEMNDLSE